MLLIKPFTSILILFISITCVELISIRGQFQRFVASVASKFHADWRQNYLREHPHTKNRFKLTVHGDMYNASDFIYPMTLTVGTCLVHRNLKVARNRYNSSLTYVDILNMDFSELPEDWMYENRATAIVACRLVLRAVRQKRLFDKQFIEEAADKVHKAWIKRNRQRVSKDMLTSYSLLPETEKAKDRNAVLIASRIFNELDLYRNFGQTPIQIPDYSIE